MGYRIGSFNCLNFGYTAFKDKDVAAFADIIRDGRFDIIALQEMRGKNALRRLLDRLPAGWAGTADDDGTVNDYAFLWNTNRVCLASAEDLAGNTVYAPRIYRQYRIDKKAGQQDLRRDPYFARFFPVNGPWVDIRIINCHIRFSKGSSDSSEDEQTPGAIAMRRNEFDVLTRAIYAKEADKRYGTSRPSYVILLGDYNLNHYETSISPVLLQGQTTVIIPGRTGGPEDTKQIITVQKEKTTLKKPDEDQNVTDFASNYDHFTYDGNRFCGTRVRCKRMDAASPYPGGLAEYRKKVSDHVPIILDLEFR